MEDINFDDFVVYDKYDNKKSNLYEVNIKNDDIIELEDALSISSYPESNLNSTNQFLIDNYAINDITKIFLKSVNGDNIFVIEYGLNIEFNGKKYIVYILVYLPISFPNSPPEFYLKKNVNFGVNKFYKGKIDSEDLRIYLSHFCEYDPKKINIGEIIDNLYMYFIQEFPVYKSHSNIFINNTEKCVLDKSKVKRVIIPKKLKNKSFIDFNMNKLNINEEKKPSIDNKEEVNKLYKKIDKLNEKIEDLTEKLKRFPFILEENEKIMSVIFTSTDQKLHYSMVCKNTDTIHDLEKDLYKEFPDYSDVENIFLCKGKLINKFQSFECNKIKNGDIIILNVRDD